MLDRVSLLLHERTGSEVHMRPLEQVSDHPLIERTLRTGYPFEYLEFESDEIEKEEDNE